MFRSTASKVTYEKQAHECVVEALNAMRFQMLFVRVDQSGSLPGNHGMSRCSGQPCDGRTPPGQGGVGGQEEEEGQILGRRCDGGGRGTRRRQDLIRKKFNTCPFCLGFKCGSFCRSSACLRAQVAEFVHLAPLVFCTQCIWSIYQGRSPGCFKLYEYATIATIAGRLSWPNVRRNFRFQEQQNRNIVKHLTRVFLVNFSTPK